jgi:hypothetical protein
MRDTQLLTVPLLFLRSGEVASIFSMPDDATEEAELRHPFVEDGHDHLLSGDPIQEGSPAEQRLVDVDTNLSPDEFVADIATRIIINCNQ